MTKVRGRLLVLVVGGAVVLGACSSSNDDSSASASATDATTSTTQASTSTDDLTAFCAVFQSIADQGRAGGRTGAGPGGSGPAAPTTKQGWDLRIATTAKIVDTAPADYKDEAGTYLQLVKDRAQLAADNGYVSIDDLPVDVRQAFIREHGAAQQIANRLIAFAKEQCNLP